MSTTTTDLRQATEVLRAWLHHEIINESCIPRSNREPGCLSCDALAVLEALDDELEDRDSGRFVAPMTTAPRDGTTIIATDVFGDEWRVHHTRGAWRYDMGSGWLTAWTNPRYPNDLVSWRPA